MLRNEAKKVEIFNKLLNPEKSEYFNIVYRNLSRIADNYYLNYLTAPQIEVSFKILAIKNENAAKFH